jgi:hypothetical protein
MPLRKAFPHVFLLHSLYFLFCFVISMTYKENHTHNELRLRAAASFSTCNYFVVILLILKSVAQSDNIKLNYFFHFILSEKFRNAGTLCDWPLVFLY